MLLTPLLTGDLGSWTRLLRIGSVKPSQEPKAKNMADCYDVIVIGAGLGGLTAAAKLAQAGRKTLLVERNYGIGGAAWANRSYCRRGLRKRRTR